MLAPSTLRATHPPGTTRRRARGPATWTSWRAPTVRAFLSLVEAHRPGPGQLLDVGGATGVFVGMAAESGWTVTGDQEHPRPGRAAPGHRRPARLAHERPAIDE